MMTLNDNEKKFQEKLQKDTEIPVIVRERANQAYHHIENNTAVQKRETNDKNALRWMKTGGKIAENRRNMIQYKVNKGGSFDGYVSNICTGI